MAQLQSAILAFRVLGCISLKFYKIVLQNKRLCIFYTAFCPLTERRLAAVVLKEVLF